MTATVTECAARWKTFSVAALHEFLNEVVEYEHAWIRFKKIQLLTMKLTVLVFVAMF